MHKTIALVVLLAGGLLCGCNKQAKINSQKIDALSQRLNQLQQTQARDMEALQNELNQLAPELNRMNSTYFEKDQNAALFFHTNTLFLLLTIGKQIETQLQLAASERDAQNSLEYTYHTNELSALYVCTSQITQALIDQQKATVDSVNAETRDASVDIENNVLAEIKASSAPDPATVAWRQQMQADLARLEQKIDSLNARLGSNASPDYH